MLTIQAGAGLLVPSRDLCQTLIRTHTTCALTLALSFSHPPLLLTTGQGWPPDPRAFPRVSVSRYPSPGRSRAPGDSHPSVIPSQLATYPLCTYPATVNTLTSPNSIHTVVVRPV
ncbi:hypothetical protein RSOLAG1IB_05911 [Rhizoctonia solani AG-1 IB]|uniref:Uncharacterized protein n=1 Tax=Thanatephorus cucumeris (strain AG1-IB / isolate 7/3/14) TaxID=1108050 RepID=A0A0B7F592_THACB|nr:hypothetical protein RSOLAG1IB_05911 [Rhizoctonia solani AG-1 IB]